ncbi:MAG: response regulator [Oscillospiraceae bacterium]|jgi:CheY-like chemotaxis protein|nr:response regulator [Oscillospiraceae bacterium]
MNQMTFELRLLLKTDVLDVRKVAAGDALLSVSKYFDMVRIFLDDTPEVLKSLSRIAALEGDDMDFRRLEDMNKLLPGIGTHILKDDFSAILDAGRENGGEPPAGRADEAAATLRALHTQVMTAVKPPVSNEEEQGELILAACLSQMDHEESNRKLRVLSVDAAAFMLQTIASALSDEYDVFSLKKGALVEKFLRYTVPELFLLDYNMPGITGGELVSVIRSFDEHKETPVIFLTAAETEESVRDAVPSVACDYIVKPPDIRVLKAKMEKHIVRKKAF